MALVRGVIARSSSSRSQRHPSPSCSGTATGIARAAIAMAIVGGHSGSATMTSSPGSNKRVEHRPDRVRAAVGRQDLFVAADGNAVLAAELVGQQLPQPGDAGGGQVVRPVVGHRLHHRLLDRRRRVERHVALIESERIVERVHQIANPDDGGNRDGVEKRRHVRAPGRESGTGSMRREDAGLLEDGLQRLRGAAQRKIAEIEVLHAEVEHAS